MGFVRKNSSVSFHPYARNNKAQVFIRELFARMRASDFQHFLKWAYNGRFRDYCLEYFSKSRVAL